MYDVIGDVHGQAAKLQALLAALGYVHRAGGWRAPQGRQAVFVGDLIDRGPDQLEVLDTARRMVDGGQARVLMGNHEFNAIGYATRHPQRNEHLRARSDKNRLQHAAFLAAVGEASQRHLDWVRWFRTLPMALDLGGLRVVHAWWDDDAVQRIEAARGGADVPLDDRVLLACHDDPALKAARKLLTCGVEMDLPPGHTIAGKEGQRHGEVRLAVWRHAADRLRDIALVPSGSAADVPDIAVPPQHRWAEVTGSPLLFGHHWFSGTVALESPKVACLDWSAAKDGPLVAYRWDGESQLHGDRLVAVGGAAPRRAG